MIFIQVFFIPISMLSLCSCSAFINN